MNKKEFLSTLKRRLRKLPRGEAEELICFYGEMIDDKIEEGLSEEQAVKDVGSVELIVEQATKESPFLKDDRAEGGRRRLRAWEIVLLALGSPIWLALGISFFAVCISLYAVLWSVLISIGAAFAAVAVSAFGGVIAGVVFILGGNAAAGGAVIGISVCCAGLAIFLFFGCKTAAVGCVALTKKIAVGVKGLFVRRT